MGRRMRVRFAASALVMSLALLTGCQNDVDKAMDQAKSQASTTNTPQQVQYVDGDGQTITKTIQPPVQGQQPQITTLITPPPPGTKPHRTKPVVMPLGTMPGSPYPNQAYNTGAQPAYNPEPGAPAPAPAPAPANSYPAQPAPNQPGAPAQPYNVTVPAGTELAVRINQRIDVKHAAAGQHFSGEIVEPVIRDGNLLIPRGTPVRGRIDAAHRRGHFKGRSVLELRLTSMTVNGNEYAIDTHDTVRSKKGKGRRSAGLIGGMTGAGMLIGGLASGGVGLAIGGASGAGAGTLLAGTTGNRDIVIPAESIVHFRLADPLVVQ